MRSAAWLAWLVATISCGGTPRTAPSPTTAGADEPTTSGHEMPAEPAPSTEPAPEPPACRPSETQNVPPTTEPLCPPETCIEALPGLQATCIDSKHDGCTHYLLLRVAPDGTTEPLNVYIRCPSGQGKLQGTLMKSYAPTGVPPLPAAAKPPAKACIHVAAYDCPPKAPSQTADSP